MIIYYVELCLYGICPFLLHFVISQQPYPNENDLNKGAGHTIKSNDKELLRILSSVEVKSANEVYENNTNGNIYHEICSQNKMQSVEEVNIHGYSDNNNSTIDAVQQQYFLLPYPTISYDTIETEYKYYLSENSDYPLSTQYSMKLEYLNHYLYKGRNSFE